MKSTRVVAEMAASGHAATRGGANRQTFSPTMAARIKSPKELPKGREREDECTNHRGTTLWSVFTFFMEGFAAYGAAVHGVSVGAALAAARFPRPWSARRTPIAAEGEHGRADLMSENGSVVELERVAMIPVSQVAAIGWTRNRKTPQES
jgi:hypothetical protein